MNPSQPTPSAARSRPPLACAPPARFETLAVAPDVTLRTAFFAAPRRVPRATVVLLHGRSEFIEKYDETLGELAERGLDVFTMDWRGQGLSSRPLANRHKGHHRGGDFARGYVDDLATFVAERVEPGLRDPDAPRILLTHSMGGHIALRYQLAHPHRVDAAIHLAPMLGIRLPAPAWLLRRALVALERLGLGERFVAERERSADTMDFDSNVLTRDRQRFEHLRQTMRHHPRLAIGGPTISWLAAALRSNALLARPQVARAIGEPMLLVLAGADRVVDNDAVRAMAAHAADAELALVPDAEHEILVERDRCRTQFWWLFDDFLERRLGLECQAPRCPDNGVMR